MSYPQFDTPMHQSIDRGQAAARSFAESLGLPSAPPHMLTAAVEAERGVRPTIAALASPYWPRFYEQHRAQWNEAEQAQWSEADLQMDELIAADRARRKATADAQATAKAEAEKADQERRAAEYDELVATIRRRYMSLPGTTEPGFLLALPGLIEDERRRRLAAETTADDVARRRQMARTRL